MSAKITITENVPLGKIIIGTDTLSDILSEIYAKVLECSTRISIERQSDNPDYEDIDAPLHHVLSLIEHIN